MTFDTFLIVDWSGAVSTGPKPKKDAIWSCVARGGVAEDAIYHPSRLAAEDWLATFCEGEAAAGRQVFAGFDFPFGYPAGFAKALTGKADPLAVWEFYADRLEEASGNNNRFDLAGQINARFPGVGPFWFNGLKRNIEGLPRADKRAGHGQRERRQVEERAKGAFTCWQMGGAGAVGGQVMTGMATLERLRRRLPRPMAVWPFEPLTTPVALVEVWPSLVAKSIVPREGEIKDAAQVRVLAEAISRLDPQVLRKILDVDAPEEGWIFGLGHENALSAAAAGPLQPPPLKDNCFALPPGIDWLPVDAALERLQSSLRTVVGEETLPVESALGRVLASDIVAARSNPPGANAAVDGYGFAQAATSSGAQEMPLVQGRAAAGAPYDGVVPAGHAVRILTGALLPKGVDTVVLEEDTTTNGAKVAFQGPVKAGANTRKAGEDKVAGDLIAPAGRALTPGDLATLSATGVAKVRVFMPLKVGVMSTGDELGQPAPEPAPPDVTYDANRPMLLSMLSAMGFQAVDLGHVRDDRAALAKALDGAVGEVDAILTSGGASAGDEDHVSALLGESGNLTAWRIAVKPGRPLALANWQGVPVFGLPGNPVAAFVCTAIFARPALRLMAGAGWDQPQGFMVPAAFAKSKKAGRREYLRARMTADGQAEVFRSEGSGRVSGLSWATGLVELGDGAAEIAPGDPVRFIPFSSFGL